MPTYKIGETTLQTFETMIFTISLSRFAHEKKHSVRCFEEAPYAGDPLSATSDIFDFDPRTNIYEHCQQAYERLIKKAQGKT